MAKLLALHYHKKGHTGLEWTLSKIREKYWITKARRIIKSVIRSCVTCKKLYAKPMQQKMADLPEDRMQPFMPSFSVTAVEVFGPYETKFYCGTKKR